MDNSSLHKIRSLPQKLGSSLHNVAVALNDQIKSSLGYGESTAEPPTMSVSPASQQKAIEGVADWLTRWKEWAVENRGRVIAYAIATGVAVVILRRVYERKYKRRSVAENESEVVVLTGADTSLGKSIALYLEQNGFVVFAAVPTTKDVEALGREGRTRLKGLVMDPTKPDSIAQAVKQVSTFLSIPLKQISSPTGSQERPHLTAVINAATATAYGPFETVPYDSWTKTLNVNVLGTALVTQSFLPLLRQNPYGTSRVVVLSSARDASLGVPFASPMSASRHAVEAMAESLRREIARFSIKVVCLQAGVRLDKEEDEEGEMGSLGVDEVWRREKTMQEINNSIASWPLHLRSVYSPYYRLAMLTSVPTRRSPPGALAEAAYDALILQNPPSRIRAGTGSWVYPIAGSGWVPRRWVEWAMGETDGNGKRRGKGREGDDGFERIEVVEE